MIYTSLYIMIFDACRSITWASGWGFGPGNLKVFGHQMALAYRLDAFHTAQKILDFKGAPPSHLPS
jgi:hypothetical protein